MNEMNSAEEKKLQERLLDEYRQAVRAMLDSSEFSRIENSSPKHAAIIIEEMIGHAHHSFCAIAQQMNPVVWSPKVIDALVAAIGRGVTVSLLVVSSGDLPHLDDISNELRSRIRRVADSETIRINLAVMDEKAVRLEYNIERDMAMFCVNEGELAGLAQTKFDTLYKNGTAI